MWRGYHKFQSDELFTRVAEAQPREQAPTSSRAGLIEGIVDKEPKWALVADDIVGEALCQEIMALALANGFTDALLNTGADRQEVGELNTSSRRGQRSTFHHPNLAARLWVLLEPLIPPLSTVPGTRYKGRWTPAGVNPTLRVLQYSPGDHFELHQDGSYTIAPSGEDPGGRSFLTLQIYLNEGGGADFTGGSTRFFKDVAAILAASPSASSLALAPASASNSANSSATTVDNIGSSSSNGAVACALAAEAAEADEARAKTAPGAVEDVVPRLGRVLLFQHNLWHCGERVSAGCKYVLRSEIMYRDGGT